VARGPTPGAQTKAYIHQMIVRKAVHDDDLHAPVVHPHAFMADIGEDKVSKRFVGKRIIHLRDYLSTLSTKHGMKTHVGAMDFQDPMKVDWTPLAANAEVSLIRKTGQSPAVQLATLEAGVREMFKTNVEANYKVPE
jgi:hypothetical protein